MSPIFAPTIPLSNGQQMPVLGLGTWRSYESEAEKACKEALDCGYRHIDTAFVYENEAEVGRAVRSKIAEGLIRREDVFIVTKLGGIHHEPKLVEHACQLSLNNLDLGYIDLYLLHFPVGQVYNGDGNVHGSGELSDVDYLDTWKEMEKLVELGMVRGIGLSNFNSQQIERVLQNCRIKPLVNQVECHPAFNQKRLIEFCRQRGIVVTAYCPLARPKPDLKWPPFIYDATAEALARKYNKTPAQVGLRYLIQIGTVPIPKSISKNRIEENFKVFDFKLSDEDIKIIDQYNTNERMIPFSENSFEDEAHIVSLCVWSCKNTAKGSVIAIRKTKQDNFVNRYFTMFLFDLIHKCYTIDDKRLKEYFQRRKFYLTNVFL